MKQEIFQTVDKKETIAILYDEDGSVSIGIARAGRADIIKRNITSDGGIKVALGRAHKARTHKRSFCDRNYLRAFYGNKVEDK